MGNRDESLSNQEQIDLRQQLQGLFNDYNLLGKKILEMSESLVASVPSPLPEDERPMFYEVVVPEHSEKADKTIGELRFWQATAATIVAIKRGGKMQISPGPYTTLRAGDTLIYVGPPSSAQAVPKFFLTGKAESTLFQIQEQISAAVHMREVATVAEALGARIGDIKDFVAMTKGMTNHSYLFSCKGTHYILRIPGEGTANLIDRVQEEEVYRAIAGTGICDDVVYLNPANGLKVTRFLEGVRTCDPYNEDDLIKCMDLLRHFHQIRLHVGHEFDIFGVIEKYESLWNGAPSVHEHYRRTKANVMSLRPYIEAHRGELCLTHIDAVPDNFLFYPEDGREELQLIDWEYAGMQDPHVDIAMFCLYSIYDKEQVDHLIDIYFEGKCDPATRIKIYCYIAAAGLLWSNWSEYKRILGIEYGDYAKYQYEYAKDYYRYAKEGMETL